MLALLNVGHNTDVIWKARNAVEKNGAETERSLPFLLQRGGSNLMLLKRWFLRPSQGLFTIFPDARRYLWCVRGVPGHDIWLDTDERLSRIIRETKPDFLFADSKDDKYYFHVTQGLKRSGIFTRRDFPTASSTRYHLFKLVPTGGRAAMEKN